MALPARPLPTSSVTLEDGTTIDFRSLSRSEAIHLRTYAGREDEAELYMISCATDTAADDAQKWYESTATADVGVLVEGIAIFSGLATKASIAKANGAIQGDGTDPKPSTNEPS